MRKKLAILFILAVVIYLFRSEIMNLFGMNLSGSSFLGIPILTDWASIALVLIFLLELVVSIYSTFLRGPNLEFVLLDEDREFSKMPIPITALAGDSGQGIQVRLVTIKVRNRGPEIAEGCHAFCRLLNDKSLPIELRWNLKRTVAELKDARMPAIRMESIPMEIQNWFDAGPHDIIPNVAAPLAIGVAVKISNLTRQAYLLSDYESEPFQESAHVKISVVGKNVRRPLHGKFHLCLDSSDKTGISKFSRLERIRASF